MRSSWRAPGYAAHRELLSTEEIGDSESIDFCLCAHLKRVKEEQLEIASEDIQNMCSHRFKKCTRHSWTGFDL